jgi:hypothetical protein
MKSIITLSFQVAVRIGEIILLLQVQTLTRRPESISKEMSSAINFTVAMCF